MPIEYAIDESCNVLVVNASGVVDVLERASLVQRLLGDYALPESIPILIDVTQVMNFPVMGDIPKFAFLVDQLSERFQSRIAYFVVKPGMVTPYHLVALSVRNNRSSVCVFSNRLEAVKWLTAN